METFEINFMNGGEPRQIDLDGPQTSLNGLSYERVAGRGVRFVYNEINMSSFGHLWFLHGWDLRAKTLRIHYSGIMPQSLSFFIARSPFGERFSKKIAFKDTDQTQQTLFPVPDDPIWKSVSVMGFEIRKSDLRHAFGDFLIEAVDVLNKPDPKAPARS